LNLPKIDPTSRVEPPNGLPLRFFVFTQKMNNRQDPKPKSRIKVSPQSVVMWVSIVVFRNTTIDNDNQPPWWCCTAVSQNCWGHKCHCSSQHYGRLLPIVLVQYNRRGCCSMIYFLLTSAAIDFLLIAQLLLDNSLAFLCNWVLMVLILLLIFFLSLIRL
jgi:hypothetical protein